MLAALSWGAASGRAQLAPSSPFLPADAKETVGAAQAGPAGPIELRGIMSTAEGASFCIYDVAKKSGTWVGLNEEGHDFIVRAHQVENDSVTVEVQGRSIMLALRKPKIASDGGGNPAMSGMEAPGHRVPAAAGPPTPEAEARRLNAITAEIQRRRAMREQAARGGQPSDAPQPPPTYLPPGMGRPGQNQ